MSDALSDERLKEMREDHKSVRQFELDGTAFEGCAACECEQPCDISKLLTAYDALLREKQAVEERYETKCAGTKSRMERIQSLEAQLAAAQKVVEKHERRLAFILHKAQNKEVSDGGFRIIAASIAHSMFPLTDVEIATGQEIWAKLQERKKVERCGLSQGSSASASQEDEVLKPSQPSSLQAQLAAAQAQLTQERKDKDAWLVAYQEKMRELEAELANETAHGWCRRHNTCFDEQPCWACINESGERAGKLIEANQLLQATVTALRTALAVGIEAMSYIVYCRLTNNIDPDDVTTTQETVFKDGAEYMNAIEREFIDKAQAALSTASEQEGA